MFLFQAEDGIRDLVRSRGLGDVYKRQGYARTGMEYLAKQLDYKGDVVIIEGIPTPINTVPVSYTHLTLPTSDLV